jgi:hypothetical protein
MKCLTEFARWKLSMSVHTVIHPSEIWSSSWDACEQYYGPYINELENKVKALTLENQKLERHNGELILDLHLQDAHKNANANA